MDESSEHTKLVECPHCIGVGQEFDGHKTKECSLCVGDGQVSEYEASVYLKTLIEDINQ